MGEMKEPPVAESSASSLDEFEIVKSEKDPIQKMGFSQVKGLELKVASSTGLIVYEMKIPLAASADIPVAVGAEPGKSIGIGFETGKIDTSKMPRGGTPPGGDGTIRPPAGGGQEEIGAMGRRGGAGSRLGLPDSLRVWALVQLAVGSAARPAEVLSLTRIP